MEPRFIKINKDQTVDYHVGGIGKSISYEKLDGNGCVYINIDDIEIADWHKGFITIHTKSGLKLAIITEAIKPALEELSCGPW